MTKRAMITGASSGIGRETALLLAAQGCDVILAARRAEPLMETAQECAQHGVTAEVVVCDVASSEDCQRMVRMARQLPGEAYPVLVNCAGFAEFGDFVRQPLELVERMVQVNLVGPMYACHYAVPWMLECGGGQVINVLSITASQVFAGSAAYSTSKAGLRMFGQVLAAEYRKKGLRVTSILPGAVNTPIWEGKSFVPKREDMMPAAAVAEAIAGLVAMPPDRNVDEIVLMPPKGVL